MSKSAGAKLTAATAKLTVASHEVALDFANIASDRGLAVRYNELLIEAQRELETARLLIEAYTAERLLQIAGEQRKPSEWKARAQVVSSDRWMRLNRARIEASRNVSLLRLAVQLAAELPLSPP